MSGFAERDAFAIASSITGPEFDVATENPKAEQLIDLVIAGELERAADELFEFSRKEIKSGRLFELNALLKALRQHAALSVEFALAVLTATLPLKSRLAERREFVAAVEGVLRARGRSAAEVLQGLV
jgi:hypothetical protein